MKYILHLFILALLFSCSTENKPTTATNTKEDLLETQNNTPTTASTVSKNETPTPQLLIASNATEPHYCPSGSLLFYLNEEGNTLTVYNPKTKENTVVLEQNGLKNNVSWGKDCNSILYKYKENYKMKFASISVNGNKKELTSNTYPALTSVASLQYSDTIFYLDEKTLNIKATYKNTEWQYGKAKQQYYNLLASPNGKYLAANNGSQIVLIDLKTNTETNLGKGLHTAWHPSGKYLIGFVDESDNGHEISNADLFLWDVERKETMQITNTKDIVEAYPSFKNTNTIIYNDLNTEGIYELNIANLIP